MKELKIDPIVAADQLKEKSTEIRDLLKKSA